MTRKQPTLREQLAAALLTADYWRACTWAFWEQFGRCDLSIEAFRVIGYEQAKRLTPEQIRAQWELDHKPVKVADATPLILSLRGIPSVNHPSNMTWEPRAVHRATTAKVDAPVRAKGKRIRKALIEKRIENAPFPTYSVGKPSRWPKGRKIASRKFRQRRSG